jgi:ubiquinone/menaquinone biosynthesis C-methylase UbiE
VPSEIPDTEYVAQMLRTGNPLIEPVDRAAIQALQLPPGSRGLDAGCGIGLQTVLLAEVVGPAGHVTGLDLWTELLVYAEETVNKAGLSERISFREGDVRNLPFDDHTFDWAWSKDCVGYGPQMQPLPLLKELVRVVKPGGTVAILSWSSERILPGHPLLEARLNATSAGIAPFVKGERPELHFSRALGWFREAGLVEATARTFVGDTHAPLSTELRSALVALFGMRWPGVESELSPEDWAEYQRLCLPESPDFIVDHPDYYAFFTYSMFHGKVAE